MSGGQSSSRFRSLCRQSRALEAVWARPFGSSQSAYRLAQAVVTSLCCFFHLFVLVGACVACVVYDVVWTMLPQGVEPASSEAIVEELFPPPKTLILINHERVTPRYAGVARFEPNRF